MTILLFLYISDPVVGFSKQAYIIISECLKILIIVPGNLLVFGDRYMKYNHIYVHDFLWPVYIVKSDFGGHTFHPFYTVFETVPKFCIPR